MFDVIQLDQNPKATNIVMTENGDIRCGNYDTTLYTEAVFTNGKKQLEKVEQKMAAVKDLLMELIDKHEKSEHKTDKFNPEAFWRANEWKELEDTIKQTFGFRNVNIEPYIERYDSKSKEFESHEITAYIYNIDRYPIDALVTDKGFYDTTHSINAEVRVTLGIIKLLTAEELVACIIHEFGHTIDPALVDITYTEVNILSKYLTDRKDKINNRERRLYEKKSKVKKKHSLSSAFIMILLGLGYTLTKILASLLVNSNSNLRMRLSKLIAEEKGDFNRKNYSEAFADNFARMYGYGVPLISAFKKMSMDNERIINSYLKREKARQKIIMDMTISAIKDEHKTDIHRCKALINEYQAEINDPNTPAEVKKHLKEDKEELEAMLKSFTTDFSNLQNTINKELIEALNKYDVKDTTGDSDNKKKEEPKKDDKEKDTKAADKVETKSDTKEDGQKNKLIKEGFEFFDESRKAYEELKAREKTLNSSERALVQKKFGYSTACSFAKDDKGYYCYTHRARSKSYPNVTDIPMKDFRFICSTS